MAVAKTSTGAKLATIAALIPIGVVLWVAAPYILPVWRWQNLDGPNAWAKIAKEKGVAEQRLHKEFKIVFRHAPRRSGDPIPWQIVTSDPTWLSQDEEKNEDETKVLVRCSMISDRDGTPPSDLWVGSNQSEKYFRATVWRFPPGSFGKNAKRPVLVYQAGTMERLTTNEGGNIRSSAEAMENDDKWEDRDDGFEAPADQ